MDVIFTIVSRNYAAQAATLMESLARAEPDVRRVVVATDGPIPQLEALAEVIDAATVGAPFSAMSVYYDALELNTAIKPYAFGHLLAQPGVTSATYLDPDIFVYRPLDGVRAGLALAQLVLTPHITRPLLGDANPNDQAILRSGVYNLGFCSGRNEPRVLELFRWWADRCRFDCRVDLAKGLFTDQKWMDLAPGFVDSVAIHRAPDMNLAYWNIEGRTLAHGPAGWTIDEQPLTFFHFSGFDPLRPKTLSKHQNRISVTPGSPLAALLVEFAEAMLRNGHAASSAIPYRHARFASGRPVGALMRRKALRAARDGEAFDDGLGDVTEAWFDAADPQMAEPGLPDITRLMEQVWRENPAADPFARATVEGRLSFHQWFADNAAVLGADEKAVAAAQLLAKRSGGSARAAAPGVWTDAPWRGAASGVFGWLREPVGGPPRVTLALLAARSDLRQRFAADPEGLLAWCLGPEAAARRFAADLLPETVISDLAHDTRLLFKAAAMAERTSIATDLGRKLSAGFGAGERARWPVALTAPLREAFLAPAPGYAPPFVKLFLDIWESRADLQRLYPLTSLQSRVRYLRWLLAGGLTEYGVEVAALPTRVSGHVTMRVARASLRRRLAPVLPPPAPVTTRRLLVLESLDGAVVPAGDMAYDASTGRFQGPNGSAAPGDIEQLCFLTAPGLIAADAVALHAKGARWRRAAGVWAAAVVGALASDDVALGFVDEVWSDGDNPALDRPIVARGL